VAARERGDHGMVDDPEAGNQDEFSRSALPCHREPDTCGKDEAHYDVAARCMGRERSANQKTRREEGVEVELHRQ